MNGKRAKDYRKLAKKLAEKNKKMSWKKLYKILKRSHYGRI